MIAKLALEKAKDGLDSLEHSSHLRRIDKLEDRVAILEDTFSENFSLQMNLSMELRADSARLKAKARLLRYLSIGCFLALNIFYNDISSFISSWREQYQYARPAHYEVVRREGDDYVKIRYNTSGSLEFFVDDPKQEGENWIVLDEKKDSLPSKGKIFERDDTPCKAVEVTLEKDGTYTSRFHNWHHAPLLTEHSLDDPLAMVTREQMQEYLARRYGAQSDKYWNEFIEVTKPYHPEVREFMAMK